MSTRYSAALLLGALALLCPGVADGAPIFFSDRAAWVQAMGEHQTLTFDGLVPAGEQEQHYDQGLQTDLAALSLGSPYSEMIVATESVPTAVGDSDFLAWQSREDPGVLTIQLAQPFNAFAFDVLSFDDLHQVYFSAFGQSQYDFTVQTPSDQYGFWGVLLDEPVSLLTLTIPMTNPLSNAAFIDNFSAANNPAPVPEPGSLILIGTGAGMLFRRLRRRPSRV